MAESIEISDEDKALLTNIYGDKRRYVQILQNFNSNAVKFTNIGGKIKVKVTVLEKQEIQSKLKLQYQKKLVYDKLKSQKQGNKSIEDVVSNQEFRQRIEIKSE